MKLIEIEEKKHNVTIDLKYSSVDNILGKKIFNENKCFLHPSAEKKLVKAVYIARKLNYRIKIFDAYRPQYVQEKLWSKFPDPDFIANPSKGSPHTKGIAIDLTLLDSNKNELKMGTGFDDLTKKSYHLSDNISLEERKNRHQLLSIMVLAGFDFYLNEWWHYQLFNSEDYELIPNF